MSGKRGSLQREITIPFDSERIRWIDICRGLAILIVMIEHLQIDPIRPYLTIFFMPVFFFISGLCFNPNKSFKSFVKGKAYSLLIPYLFFSCLCILAYLTYAFIFEPSLISIKLIVGLFYGRASFTKDISGEHLIMGGFQQMWFLLALFVIEIFFYLICFIEKKISKHTYIYIYIYA